MPKKIILLNSLPDDIISGGNVYNKHLIEGLVYLGVRASTQIVDLTSSWVDDLEKGTVYLLDSILLRYDIDWDKLSEYKVAILLHMCPSLDSDLSVEEKSAIPKNELIAYQQFPIISTGINNLNYISETLGIQTKNNVVISPAVSNNWLKCKKLPKTPTRFLTIGGVSSGKGLQRTLEVLRLIDHLSWTWSHFGPVKDEDVFADLEQQVKTYGLGQRVQFHGVVNHETINDTLLVHHLLLHLSDHENYGMTIKESIATGLPFISTPVGDHKNWTDSRLGWVAAGFNVVDISKLLSNVIQDKQEYSAMVEHLKSIDIDTWDNVAERTLQFLQSNLC